MKIPVIFAMLCILIVFLGLDPAVAQPLLKYVALTGIMLTLVQLGNPRITRHRDD